MKNARITLCFIHQDINRAGIICPVIRDSCSHVFHQYAIRVTPDSGISRDQFAEDLYDHGVGTAIH